MTARSRPAVLAALATTGLLGVGLTPAHAAVLDDQSVEGVQFVTADRARPEYVVDATVTGTTDDVGGFDRFLVRVWDDGTIKDSRTAEVPVGATQDVTVFLSFMGLYGTGAPGVGIEILDVDGAGTELGQLSYDDPFFPDEQDGYCAFDIERIGGADRIQTAALLSSQKLDSADTAFLATSTTYPTPWCSAPSSRARRAPCCSPAAPACRLTPRRR